MNLQLFGDIGNESRILKGLRYLGLGIKIESYSFSTGRIMYHLETDKRRGPQGR